MPEEKALVRLFGAGLVPHGPKEEALACLGCGTWVFDGYTSLVVGAFHGLRCELPLRPGLKKTI